MLNNKQQVNMKIDLDDLKVVTCPNCKNSVFRADSSMFKRIPAIQSPTGKAQFIQIPLLTCSICRCSFIIKDGELLSIAIKEEENEITAIRHRL